MSELVTKTQFHTTSDTLYVSIVCDTQHNGYRYVVSRCPNGTPSSAHGKLGECYRELVEVLHQQHDIEKSLVREKLRAGLV